MHTPHEVVLFTRSMDDSDTAARLQERAAALCPRGEAEVHSIDRDAHGLLVDDPTPEQIAELRAVDGWEWAEVSCSGDN